MFHEGQLVTSIGDGSDGTPLGSHGRVLMLASVAAGHVQWTSGPRAGEVSFIPQLEDSVAALPASAHQASAGADLLEDSLEYGTVHHTGVQHELATGGPHAVFRMLASSGALSDASEMAEEALSFLDGRLRSSGSVMQHLAEVDPDDRYEIIRLTSMRLLAEALGGYGD
jgi:hypothetical protein